VSDEYVRLTEDEKDVLIWDDTQKKRATKASPISDLVARLTRPEREARVQRLVSEADHILLRAIDQHVLRDNREVAAIVTLFSGGNDSTVLAHLFRERATHAGHANTTIGIEQTREFVRNTCAEWGLPLLERTSKSEADSYRSLVLDQGFPGPGHHFKMFQRLKERAIEQMQRELVGNPYRQRVIFLAGRRRDESQRRAAIPESERNRSKVWVSPLVNWTKLDLNTYRLMHDDVPVNEVSDLIHMSGECLCGAFASPGERAEVSAWFPDVFEVIAALEAEIADRDDIPVHRRTWGWGADPAVVRATRTKASKTGALCTSCDDRFADQEPMFDVAGGAA
jgi:3'-phosphoadenosine 5'-phosphosulfate sulfotransferase (PAPS reductase)/FAD synthetase